MSLSLVIQVELERYAILGYIKHVSVAQGMANYTLLGLVLIFFIIVEFHVLAGQFYFWLK